MWKNMSSYDAFKSRENSCKNLIIKYQKMYMQMDFGNFIYKLLGKTILIYLIFM